AQPMGFYAPGTLIEDAKRHGVRVLPIDIRHSGWDHSLESSREPREPPALRLGLRIVNGLGPRASEIFEEARAAGPFTSIEDFVRRARFDRRALRLLATAGAFDGFLQSEPDLQRRRMALWHVLDAARGDAGPLAPRRAWNRPTTHDPRPTTRTRLPPMS